MYFHISGKKLRIQFIKKIDNYSKEGRNGRENKQMPPLLHKNSNLELNHVKWFRNIDQIEMKQSPYLLTITQNKREFIYKNNLAIDTKAFVVKDNFIV